MEKSIFSMVCLAATVAAPVILTILGVTYCVGSGDNIRSKFLSVFELRSEHGLVTQGLLWLAIGLPLNLGLALGIWVWSDYSINLSAEGYKKFVEISILPLAIMSISSISESCLAISFNTASCKTNINNTV